MRSRSKAFTLIELLVVIGILAVLMSILVWGMSGFGQKAKLKETHGRMETLKSMLEQLRLANNLKDVPQFLNQSNQLYYANGTATGGVFDNPFEVRPGSPNRFESNAITYTQLVMGLLRSVPSNATTFQNLSADWFMQPASSTQPPLNPPVMLDSWGNPMILVPGGPPGNIEVGGLRGLRDKSKVDLPTPRQAPNNRPFWASAGPDGDFKSDADNVYSFEN